jgi:hypothetical protein
LETLAVGDSKLAEPLTRNISWETKELLLDLSFDVLFREKARTAFTTLCFSVFLFFPSFCFSTLRGLSAYLSGSLALYTLTLPGYYITRANRPTRNGMEWNGHCNEFYLIIRTSGGVFGFDAWFHVGEAIVCSNVI